MATRAEFLRALINLQERGFTVRGGDGEVGVGHTHLVTLPPAEVPVVFVRVPRAAGLARVKHGSSVEHARHATRLESRLADILLESLF